MTSINEIAEICAEHLPEGWEISIGMQKDSAWVELSRKGKHAYRSVYIEDCDSAEDSIQEQINLALWTANGGRE